MTAVRIRCISVANPVADPDPPAGQFLSAYDPEALGGRGSARWTRDPAKALVFADPGAALDCWQQVPRNCPERPDGRPNRPLDRVHDRARSGQCGRWRISLNR